MELQPVQRVVEMKAVAEQLHFKISNLLLHGGKETEAVRWFREHASWYKQMMGPFEGAFLHWAWVSRQFQVFGELLQNRLATASQTPTPNSAIRGQPVISERELQPAHYYHVRFIWSSVPVSACWSLTENESGEIQIYLHVAETVYHFLKFV